MFSFFNNKIMQAFCACFFTFSLTISGALILLIKKKINDKTIGYLYSIVAGLVLSTTIFNLIIPFYLNNNRFLWCLCFIFGFLSLFVLDCIFINNKYKLLSMLALHNIPEGISLGVILFSNSNSLSFVLSLGISNILDGFFSIFPLKKYYINNKKIFILSFIIALIEPIFCIIFLKYNYILININKYIIAFCCGTMIYTLYTEIIKESFNSKLSSLLFLTSFILVLYFS